jgi:hypothetical protein
MHAKPTGPFWFSAPISRAGRAATLLAAGLLLAGVSAAPAMAQKNVDHTCNIDFVRLPANGSRLAVNCNNAASGGSGATIRWFAFHIGQHPQRARMFLSVLLAAKAAGRQVRIHYVLDDKHPSGWDMFCDPADCRPIQAIDMF